MSFSFTLSGPAGSHGTDPRRFKDLILNRVREILLVSSPYDAFILEEEGSLTEQVYLEYQELSLSAAPRFTHASNTREALRLLKKRRFDLVLTMTGLSDLDVNAFGRKVKKVKPGCPVVLLSLDNKDRRETRGWIDPKAIDREFVWGGDSKIMLAIIKYVEDRLNVAHDVKHGNVRVIIMLEDSARHYSSFLRVLYKELMTLSKSLYSEGQNRLYRLLYMRSRPKILLATSYEEATKLFHKYRSNLLAVISDIRIPKKGELDATAGLKFVRFTRKHDSNLPILLQSSDTEKREEAEALNVAFLDKNSPKHLTDVKGFLRMQLGFGDFVFRTPDGQELDWALDIREFEDKVKAIPEESFVYHATHNHFSIWLMARSEFELAEELRPRRVSDFASPEHCRQHLLQALKGRREISQKGVTTDFDPYHYEGDVLNRIGDGALGGKARGISFLNLLLSRTSRESLGGLKIRLPETVVITTDEFDRFLVNNELLEFAYRGEEDEEVVRRFIAASLSNRTRVDLRFLVETIDGPLAVRSSSLLEDSLHQPFAGIYSTLMIPNNEADLEVRHRNLCNAVKLVYASTFCKNARSYLNSTGNRVEEEKMAVIIQRLVGQLHDDRFYPSFSGVAQSHNYYPIGPQNSEDGIVHVGLGLGRLVVDGGHALRFSPRHPQVLPQLGNLKSFIDCSQRGFWALDMRSSLENAESDFYSTLKFYDLTVAEADGTLESVSSVFSFEDNRLREDLSLAGPRLVTFANILKHQAIPLPSAMDSVLEMAEVGVGCAVEVEFACDMGDWGQTVPRGQDRREPTLYLLQVRPFATRTVRTDISSFESRREEILAVARLSLGHGIDRSIQDIVYVRRDAWEASANQDIARQVGQLNDVLTEDDRRYLLMGPGRWGTADPWLGIPVQWSQISSARVIVEASPKGYDVDPSQGTHFFHNITSLGIGYLTLPPGVEKEDEREEFVDWRWLDSKAAIIETEHLRCVRLPEPLLVVLDGRLGHALIGKKALDSPESVGNGRPL